MTKIPPLPPLDGSLPDAEFKAQAEAHWSAVWDAADLPDRDRAAWREAMAYRTKSPDDAVRMAACGVTPQQVVAARTIPSTYQVQTAVLGCTPEEKAAKAALADETARFHDFYREIALTHRGAMVQDLARHRGDGWTYDRIGALIGVTKQRARVIARRGARPQPEM